MPYGAHEAMETNEILMEKTCMIEHFALYLQQVRDHRLGSMLDRHLSDAMRSYHEMVSYTHDYHQVSANQHSMTMMATPQSIKYGLHQPQPTVPHLNGMQLNEQQIALAMLCSHKNSAKNHMTAALECSDPNLRQMMINGANQCAYAAYEVFQYMNERGWYQVPTLEDHTAKTLLHRFQPMNQPQTSMTHASTAPTGAYGLSHPPMSGTQTMNTIHSTQGMQNPQRTHSPQGTLSMHEAHSTQSHQDMRHPQGSMMHASPESALHGVPGTGTMGHTDTMHNH